MIIHLLSGATAMGFAAAGVFFLRFWWQSRDRLFVLFALALFTLSASRVLLSLLQDVGERGIVLYTVRLVAFLVILVAIVDKNLRRS